MTLNVPDGVTFNSASDGGSESGGLAGRSSLATNAEPTYRFASMTAERKGRLTFTAEATTTYTTAVARLERPPQRPSRCCEWMMSLCRFRGVLHQTVRVAIWERAAEISDYWTLAMSR